MPEEIKIYKKGDQTYNVPAAEVKDFLKEVPDAVEINVYKSGDTTYDVPINELDAFMTEVPDATLVSGSKKKAEPPVSDIGKGGPGRGSTQMSLSQITSILKSNKDKNFVKRILDTTTVAPLERGGDVSSSHSMGWGEVDGEYYVYPTVVEKDGKLVDIKGKDPLKYALDNNEYIKFKTPEEAEAFSNDSGYKQYWEKEERPTIDRITADLPQSSSARIENPVTTLGEFLTINQATPNDLGFATMINPELPLTQEEVNKYTNIARNNKLAGMPQVSSDYDIKPVLEKTQRQIELDEMDNNDKARQYLSTRVFDESVMGKLIKPVIGKIVGITKEERIHLDELARMAADIDESGEAESYAYDANMVQRVAGGLLAIMADTPIFGGIGAAVKIPTLAFGRLVGSGVSKLGASRAVVQAMTNIFSSSPQMAAVLGGHAVLNELTEQVINQGKVFGEDPENGGVDMRAVAEVGGKQAIVGAMIGPVGSGTSILSNSSKITGLINNSIGQQAAKAGINAAGLVAESAVFAYGDALVDRERKLSDVSGEEFLESLMTIGGLKAMHLPSRIKAPRKSQRTKTEIDAINKHIDTGPESKSGIEQLKADKAKLDAVMNDPSIPWEAKAEIANSINGVNPSLWEPVLNRADLIETPDGVHQLTSYDANGNKISIRDFQSKSEAFLEYNNMDQIMQENNTMINIRNADVKEITKVDKALIDIGYPDGIRDQTLNDAIITPKPNRTAKQNAMVEDLMEAAGKIKTEPAKEKKPEERMERPSAELKVEETKDGKFTVRQEGTEVAPEFETREQADRFVKNFKDLTQGERTFEQEKAIIDKKVAAGEAKKPEPKVTKKPKEDAVQKREAKKVDVEEPAAPGKEVGEGKGIKKEKVTYVTKETSEKYADMSEAPDGDYVFFHNSGEKRNVIDPSKSGTNKMMPTSKAEAAAAATVGGVSYYYTDTKGHDVGGVEHRVKVPKKKVYDADADPLNLGPEAKKQYQEKHPGKGWDNNHRVFWITKLAAEKGYDITVATWGDKTRAHSVKKMTPTEGVEFTEARKEGYTRQEPVYAEKVYTDILDKINKQRNKEGVYDELYHARANYQNPKSDLYKNKEALTDLVKKSNLPEALKTEYLTSLTAQDVPGKAIPPKVAEPPAKVPPKPPKPPAEPPELPGPGEGKKPDGVKAVGRRRKARKEAAKKEDSYSLARWEYLFSDQQGPFKRLVLKTAKKAAKGEKEAQRMINRLNTERGTKTLTADEYTDKMKEVGVSILGDMNPKKMELLSEFNDVRRTKELYKSREAFGKAQLKEEGGMTLKEAEDFLDRVKKKDPAILEEFGLKDYDPKKIIEASDKFNEYYREMLDEMVDEGIITKEAYDQITFEHPYYSPRKYMEVMDRIDQGGSMSGVETLKGGSEGAKQVDAPSLFFDALARKNNIIARARTLRYAEKFIDKVEPSFMRKAEYDPAYLEKLDKAEKGDPWIEPKFEDTPQGMEPIDYKDATGHTKRIFMNSDVYKYYELQPFSDLSRKIMNVAGWVSGSKALKAAATGYNPEFLVKNIPIDVMHILNTTTAYPTTLPVAYPMIMADMAFVGKAAATKTGIYKEYIKYGGGMRMLSGEGKLRGGRSTGKIKKGSQLLDAGEGLLSYPGETSELLTRLALTHRQRINLKNEYKKEYGKEPDAAEMKEITMDAVAYARNYLDFEQGGRVVKIADSVIPYLNAGFQVTRGSLRAAGKNPGLFAAKLAQLAATAAAITAWNMGLFTTDNIDEETAEGMKKAYLNDISDEVKAKNFVIMTPKKYTDAAGNERYLYRKIPKDNMQELITGIAEDRVHKQVLGEEFEGYLTTRRLKELQVSIQSFTNVSSLPPMVRGALGYQLNKDLYYNAPIWPSAESSGDYGRDKSLEFRMDTPERFKAMGKIPLPGGHRLSPMRSHYFAKQFFTESNVIGTGIGEMMDFAVGGINQELKTEYTPGEVEKLKNTPFRRRFIKATYPGAAKKDYDTHEQDYNKLKKIHNDELDKLMMREAPMEDVMDYLDSVLKDGNFDVTSGQENKRLLRRYENRVLKPSAKRWVEKLKYEPAIPRAEDLFDQWLIMNDTMRNYLIEEAAAAGILTDVTGARFFELVDMYETEQDKTQQPEEEVAIRQRHKDELASGEAKNNQDKKH